MQGGGSCPTSKRLPSHIQKAGSRFKRYRILKLPEGRGLDTVQRKHVLILYLPLSWKFQRSPSWSQNSSQDVMYWLLGSKATRRRLWRDWLYETRELLSCLLWCQPWQVQDGNSPVVSLSLSHVFYLLSSTTSCRIYNYSFLFSKKAYIYI